MAGRGHDVGHDVATITVPHGGRGRRPRKMGTQTGVDEEMLKFSAVVPSEKMNEGTERTAHYWVICSVQNWPHLDHWNLILAVSTDIVAAGL